MNYSFKLAPMSPLILALTVALWGLPCIFILWAVFTAGPVRWTTIATVCFLLLLYGMVWVGFRPARFLITADQLKISFPARQRSFPLADLGEVQILSETEFRQKFGWALRIGVGGLWGGFGWLYTGQKGMLEFYISRSDGLVWIERRSGNDLLLTPDQPEHFIQALQENRSW
jgi:hypothetical protein